MGLCPIPRQGDFLKKVPCTLKNFCIAKNCVFRMDRNARLIQIPQKQSFCKTLLSHFLLKKVVGFAVRKANLQAMPLGVLLIACQTVPPSPRRRRGLR